MTRVLCVSGSQPSVGGRRLASRGAPARPRGVVARTPANANALSSEVVAAQDAVYAAIQGVKGRGASGISDEAGKKLAAAVEVLEADGGLAAPTASGELINGVWKLLFTTRPGSASPIQRTFTGVESFTIYQNIELARPEGARVNNVVNFNGLGVLRVEAEAITDSRPNPDFVPRQGEGIPLFGRSMSYPAARADMRIDFAFDNAAFDFKALPFKIPYPVPFRLLGDETRGWIDITYLSPDGRFRLARGNKGTLFILEREDPPVYEGPLEAQLKMAIENEDDEKVLEVVEALKGGSDIANPAASEQAKGVWRQVWSKQADSANPLQSSLKDIKQFQVVEGPAGEGRVQNLVEFLPFLKLRAGADCKVVDSDRTELDINTLQIEVGPWVLDEKLDVKLGPWIKEIDVNRTRKTDTPRGPGYLEVLYLTDRLRVSRGNQGSTFVHVKVQDSEA